MSAFLISANHFNTCEEAVISLTENTILNNGFYLYVDGESKSIGRDFSEEQIKQYFASLKELNVVSYCHKYSHHLESEEGKTIEDIIPELLQHLQENKESEKIEFDNKVNYFVRLLRLLECILYQIEEEHMPEGLTDEHKQAIGFVEAFNQTLMEKIVHGLPASRNCEWAI